ncbi:hypothetical protein KFZ56_14025 [Virgibacillus sp. NKC19-3]|uniref:hypothetical protein n=1 Tax=Virgibacillus saliphilus TaxID=2831674 RepID=UPI001C9B702E|nr:hypothetical protein [Virgibacillus sp. NKC19-3]MBY7144146.1 hypothetical protein [Virgibacillus sp. NKC19-3]
MSVHRHSFSMYVRNASQVAELSGMTQSMEYVLAAVDTMFIGYLRCNAGLDSSIIHIDQCCNFGHDVGNGDRRNR